MLTRPSCGDEIVAVATRVERIEAPETLWYTFNAKAEIEIGLRMDPKLTIGPRFLFAPCQTSNSMINPAVVGPTPLPTSDGQTTNAGANVDRRETA